MRHQLSYWTNPWRPAQDLFNLSPDLAALGNEETTYTHIPACEVEEGKDHFLITLDVPGVSKEDIKVRLESGKLVVSAVRKQDRQLKDDKAYFSERRYGTFQRVFDLGEHVDPTKIDAAYRDGVLRIALGKSEDAKPREVEVKGEEKGGLFERLTKAKEKLAV